FFGATGFKFKNALVMQDDYFPSALGYPFSDATNGGLGNNLTTTITYSAPTSAPNNFPNAASGVTTLEVAEVGVFFNTSRIKFRISNSREFGFNPTDFIRAPDNTRIVSQLKAAVNMEFTAPWTGTQLYGLNG